MNNDSDIAIKVGNRISELRKLKGLTLQEAADLTGVNKTQFNAYEKHTREPTLTPLKRIADGFGIKLSDLFSDEPLDKGKVCILADECNFYKPPQSGSNGGKAE